MLELLAGSALASAFKGGVGAVAGKVAANAKSDVAAIPPKVWYALAAIALLVAGYLYHQHRAAQHDAALVRSTNDARDKLWQGRFDQLRVHAEQVRQDADDLHIAISQKLKEQYNAQVAGNSRTAAELVRSGPGKAAAVGCRSIANPVVPAASGRDSGPAAGADAAAAQVPAGNGFPGVPGAPGRAVRDSALALVPWSWLSQMAQEHDDLRAYKEEDQAWHRQHGAAWVKMRADLAKAAGQRP